MKKGASKVLLTSLVLVIVLLSVSFVVAPDSIDPKKAGEDVRGVGQWVNEFLQGLLFGSTEPDNPMAAVTHIFMGLVLFVLIFSAMDILNLFPRGGKSGRVFNILISIGVTMLALIALPTDFFSYILPSYGAMGAALLTVLPFIIVFIFSIRVRSVFFAQLTWIIFAIYFIGFYILKATSVFETPNLTTTQFYGGILYLVIGIIGFIMIFFIPMMRGWFKKGAVDEQVNDIENSKKLTKALFGARKEEAKAMAEMGNPDE